MSDLTLGCRKRTTIISIVVAWNGGGTATSLNGQAEGPEKKAAGFIAVAVMAVHHDLRPLPLCRPPSTSPQRNLKNRRRRRQQNLAVASLSWQVLATLGQ
mmetsp:Transcript_28663/g.57681  ORF Transcript_28663/g.57681 Transcript_28663/m.57681 type:complete len:100 (-) Transcript_28663:83-382(-)